MGPSIGAAVEEVVGVHGLRRARPSRPPCVRTRLPTSTTGCRNVRCPSRPCGSGTSERSSSPGELMAPPATTTVPRHHACAGTALLDRAVDRHRHALHRLRTWLCAISRLQRAGLHQQCRAAVERRGDGRHQHRLLGVGGAAHARRNRGSSSRLHVAQDGRGCVCRASRRLSSTARCSAFGRHQPWPDTFRRRSACWNHGDMAASLISGNSKRWRQWSSVGRRACGTNWSS